MLYARKSPRQDVLSCAVVRDSKLVELVAQMTGAWGAYEKMSPKNLNLVVFGRGCVQELASIYGTFCYLVSPDGLAVETGSVDDVPSPLHLMSITERAYDIPFAEDDDVDILHGFFVPDAIGATSRSMKYLDNRATNVKDVAQQKLTSILYTLYFIDDETLQCTGYKKEEDITLQPDKSIETARAIEQAKQAFATLF